MRLRHGSGVKGGDLVLLLVGHDGALRRVAVLQHRHMRCADAKLAQAVQIMAAIATHRGQRQRRAAQLLQRVGDIAGAATVVTAHLRGEEGDAELVDLFGQDMVGKAARKAHDAVVGQGAGNKNAHGRGLLHAVLLRLGRRRLVVDPA